MRQSQQQVIANQAPLNCARSAATAATPSRTCDSVGESNDSLSRSNSDSRIDALSLELHSLRTLAAVKQQIQVFSLLALLVQKGVSICNTDAFTSTKR
jgi:hypothetical protein